MSTVLETFESIIESYMNKEMSGKTFNELFSNIEFVKLTNQSEIHNGYLYYDGLNTDTHEFNHDRSCSKGGFYFTVKEYAYRWIQYGRSDIMCFTRKVTLPDNAKVFIESFDKFKVDKFILGPSETIDIDVYVETIEKNGIFYIHDTFTIMRIFEFLKSKEFIFKVVNLDWHLLECVPNDMIDEELCTTAVKQNSSAMKFVPSHISSCMLGTQ